MGWEHSIEGQLAGCLSLWTISPFYFLSEETSCFFFLGGSFLPSFLQCFDIKCLSGYWVSAIENAPVLWGMSDVSPGRICKFNSAAGANVQSCGDYFPPSPPPALGKFANLIPPFPTSVYLKNLTMVFKDFHKSTLTNHISGAIDKKERRPN